MISQKHARLILFHKGWLIRCVIDQPLTRLFGFCTRKYVYLKEIRWLLKEIAAEEGYVIFKVFSFSRNHISRSNRLFCLIEWIQHILAKDFLWSEPEFLYVNLWGELSVLIVSFSLYSTWIWLNQSQCQDTKTFV